MDEAGSCLRCGRPLPPYAGTGRRPRYCGQSCRKLAYRSRHLGGTTHRPLRGQTPLTIRAEVTAQAELGLDAAACPKTTLVAGNWLGPQHPDPQRRDALAYADWSQLAAPGSVVWLHPPAPSIRLRRQFLERAAATAARGREVWALLPAATGARWFHATVVAADAQVRFYPSSALNGTPPRPGPLGDLPLLLAIYRPPQAG